MIDETMETMRVLEVVGVLVGAFATLSAVVLALFLPQIQERRRRPKLEIKYDPDSPHDNRYLSPTADPSGPGEDRHEVWLRVRVRNTSNFPAKDVELKMIASLFGKDRIQQNRPGWSFKVSNLDAIRTTIHPGFSQYFDVAFAVYAPTEKELRAHLVLTRSAAPEWQVEKSRIEASREYTGVKIGYPYQVFFAVVGSNIDASYYGMKLQFTPVSDRAVVESTLRQCLVVREPIRTTPELAFDGGNKYGRQR